MTLQNAARLSLHDKQMVINQEGNEFTLPIEDLCAIVLDSPQINLTSALLGYLQNHNVMLMTCDTKHVPNGVLHAFHQHSRQSEVSQLQRIISLPLQKRLWQRVVQYKIKNQARCLALFAPQEAKTLEGLAERVESGDKGNIEAYAAKLYWPSLYGANFRRHDDCLANSALNYGYAILRGMVCRAIVAYGLIPSYGIHHKNELNAFNLADDLIEPYRPLVDMLVKGLIHQTSKGVTLTKELRAQLVASTFLECRINGEIHTLQNAVEKTSSSFVNALQDRSADVLKLPEVISEPRG